ncbi:hypothetical protein SAMN02745244_03679 [Tessaracoccus bendigoensis DSM 12906]|uniref:DUF4919 domain-containing protein n=1 Tax=Tessaracoccus bendigoensis DSM 12906 TaxID=1123357 RepID=A0A1M6NNE2_9ACTN|nr:hypothetical protein [Tessaracoccus bendigoensis]SHJ97277.1 hypothetical protein SAMN02745244_03679 [Tessaracoccus bendigoensis DSM 12906]
MAFKDAAADYIDDANAVTLDALREAILACPSYTPTPRFMLEARRLAASGRHWEAINLVAQWMPGAFLSPSAHSLLAESLAAVGDDAEAGRERFLTRLAIQTLIRTGDGSRERPWIVLRVDDEYDLLRWTRRTPVQQRLAITAQGPRDVIEHDRGESWFAIYRSARPAGASA